MIHRRRVIKNINGALMKPPDTVYKPPDPPPVPLQLVPLLPVPLLPPNGAHHHTMVSPIQRQDAMCQTDPVYFVTEEPTPPTKPILLVCSRDLDATEKALLHSYGVVMEWDSCLMNIPLHAHEFDYAILDLHNKDVRILLMKTDLSRYRVVIISHSWETEEDFQEEIAAENVIHHLPPRQAFVAEFNHLLLAKKIHKPSCGKALLRFLLRCG